MSTNHGAKLLGNVRATLAEVGTRVGASRQIVSNWIRGEKRPAMPMRRALELAYAIPVDAWDEAPREVKARRPAGTNPRPKGAPRRPPLDEPVARATLPPVGGASTGAGTEDTALRGQSSVPGAQEGAEDAAPRGRSSAPRPQTGSASHRANPSPAARAAAKAQWEAAAAASEAAQAPEPEPELPAPLPTTDGATPSTLDSLRALLVVIQRSAARPNLATAERMKLADSEARILIQIAKLEERAELLEDRIVTGHPFWRRLRGLIADALDPYPDAARAVIAALEGAGA